MSPTAYAHRQSGRLAVAVIVLLALGPLRHFVYAAALQRATVMTPFAVLALLALLVAGVLASRLNTEVGHGHIVWSFGPGFFRRTIPLSRVQHVEATRLPWLATIGFRRDTDGATYAVAGGPAVELTLQDGSCIRLGTDDPEGLVHAIHGARAEA